MLKLKKTIIICAVSIILPPLLSAPAISPDSYFTPGEKKTAVTGEFLTSAVLKGKGEVSTSGVENTAAVQNSFITTSLNSYDMVAFEKGFFYMENSSVNKLKIYRAMTDFNYLKGMVYYSKTRDEKSTLIVDSCRIPSPEDYTKGRVNGTDVPEVTVSRFAVKDNRLGLLNFTSELVCSDIDFKMINRSSGNASIYGMRIFNPGDYLIYKTLIYDKKLKGYFFYTVQYMKVRSSILEKFDLIKPESFGNRIRAENVHFLKSIGIDRSDKLAAFR